MELLDKAMQNARILAIVEFDPGLFLFTSALQQLIRKGQEVLKKKKTASDRGQWACSAALMLTEWDRYLLEKGVSNESLT